MVTTTFQQTPSRQNEFCHTQQPKVPIVILPIIAVKTMRNQKPELLENAYRLRESKTRWQKINDVAITGHS